jgi:uncharacterized low-complexity protein
MRNAGENAMPKYKTIKPIFATFAVSLSTLAPQAVRADQNPFSATELKGGYMIAENQSSESAPTDNSQNRGAETNTADAVKVSDEKIKEGTCAAEHRKAMEGMCGGMAGTKTSKPHD